MTRFNPKILFLILVVLALAGAGVWVGINKVFNDPAFCIHQSQPMAIINAPKPVPICTAIPFDTQITIIISIVTIGAVAGALPRTKAFHTAVSLITKDLEKISQEGSIKEYFKRYYP